VANFAGYNAGMVSVSRVIWACGMGDGIICTFSLSLSLSLSSYLILIPIYLCYILYSRYKAVARVCVMVHQKQIGCSAPGDGYPHHSSSDLWSLLAAI